MSYTCNRSSTGRTVFFLQQEVYLTRFFLHPLNLNIYRKGFRICCNNRRNLNGIFNMINVSLSKFLINISTNPGNVHININPQINSTVTVFPYVCIMNALGLGLTNTLIFWIWVLLVLYKYIDDVIKLLTTKTYMISMNKSETARSISNLTSVVNNSNIIIIFIIFNIQMNKHTFLTFSYVIFKR